MKCSEKPICGSSRPEVFLVKGVLKICGKFTTPMPKCDLNKVALPATLHCFLIVKCCENIFTRGDVIFQNYCRKYFQWRSLFY